MYFLMSMATRKINVCLCEKFMPEYVAYEHYSYVLHIPFL